MENTVISHLYMFGYSLLSALIHGLGVLALNMILRKNLFVMKYIFGSEETTKLLLVWNIESIMTNQFFFLLVYFYITVSVSIIYFFYIIYQPLSFFNWNFLCQGWWMNWFLEAKMTWWQSTSFYDWGRGWKKPKIVCFSLWLNR